MEPFTQPAQAAPQFDGGTEPAVAGPCALQGHPGELFSVPGRQEARLLEDDPCVRVGNFSFFNRFQDLPLGRGQLRGIIQGACC